MSDGETPRDRALWLDVAIGIGAVLVVGVSGLGYPMLGDSRQAYAVLALNVSAAVPMVLARRQPRMAMGCHLAVLTGAAVAGLMAPNVMSLVLAYLVVVRCRAVVAAALTLASITLTVLASMLGGFWRHGLISAAGLSDLIVPLLVAVGIAVLRRRSRARTDQLRRSAAAARDAAVRDEERSTIGEMLSSTVERGVLRIAAGLDRAERLAGHRTEQRSAALSRVHRDTRATLADLRAMLGILRSPATGVLVATPEPVGRLGPGDVAMPLGFVAVAVATDLLNRAQRVREIGTLPTIYVLDHLQVVGALLAMTLPLVLWRRAPVLAALGTVTTILLGWYLFGIRIASLYDLPYLLMFTLGRWAPRRWAVPTAVLVIASQFAVYLEPNRYPVPELAAVNGATLVLTASMLFAAGVLSQYDATQEDRARQEHRYEQERALRRAERDRAARDAHDVIGHYLSAVAIHTAVALREPGQGSSAPDTAIAEARGAAFGAVAALPGLVSGPTGEATPLTAADEARADAAPLHLDAATLDRLVSPLRAAGAPVTIRSEGVDAGRTPRADAAELCGYRITQEAVTNVLRHAGAAPTTVSISRTAGELLIEVHNRAGVSANGPTPAGQGVLGMHERAALIRGNCLAGPDGDGWTVRARLPIEPLPEQT